MEPTPLLADLLSPPDLARELDCTERTLKRWQAIGYGPKPIKIGGRVFYRRAAVKEWIDAIGTEQPTMRRTRR